MLSTENNELICRVGPGTPMGEMMREYWWPVLRSDKLEPDGAPERVRLLGEDYVAFRATDGRVGVLDERCPHRSVSLMLARNEDCGLRCILHGWKVSVDGNVVETPNEKEGGARLERLKVRHLPVREAGGMIWVFAGKGEAPSFPDFSFNRAVSVEPMMGRYHCNWLQLIETLWDSSHVQILHAQGTTFAAQFEGLENVGLTNEVEGLWTAGFESRDTEYGWDCRYTEGVAMGGGMPLWIPTVMPAWVFITSFAENPFGDRVVLGHVPVDDEHTILIQIVYNMESELGALGRRSQEGLKDPHNFVPDGNTRENNWQQDREAMKNGSFTGIGQGMFSAGLLLQDKAALESMGPIVDRTVEQIGPADHCVVKARAYYIEAVKAHMAGGEAPGVNCDVSAIGQGKNLDYIPDGFKSVLAAE